VAALERIDVVRGTIVLVPAGTVHAIGGGILLAEIQQPVDRTLRLFDYGSERPLHIEAALDAVAIDARAHVWHPSTPPHAIRGQHLDLVPRAPGRSRHDAASDEFVVVAVSGTVVVHAATTHALEPGALCLCSGGAFELEVRAGGLAVLGSCPRE
jgi:mannose-6-phosphate isomerase